MELFPVLSTLIGTVVGFCLGMLGDEIRRKQSEKRERIHHNRILQSWLFRFQNRWSGYEKLVQIGGEDTRAFRNELQWYADRINETLTTYAHDIDDNIYSETVELSNELWKLGQIGEKTQKEFLKKGNELVDRAQKIVEEIDISLGGKEIERRILAKVA